MERKTLKIGLFGFGVVGKGLYEVLEITDGLKAKIVGICVKDRNKVRPDIGIPFTYYKNDLLDNPEINVIVELIDDAHEAYNITRIALENGKAVVSANKKMIAEHLPDILRLQQQYQTPLLYEAACCASIPIIRNLEEYYDNDLLVSLSGIINGSTNYILTQTRAHGLTYAEALLKAQQLGYAETDPMLDVSGQDARYKLALLLVHAFGLVVQPEALFALGIDRLKQIDIQYAREKNVKIKLIANAYKTAVDSIIAFVMPQFIQPDNNLYIVEDVLNGVSTKTTFADEQFFVGKGAGAHPTASAVLSDLSALTYHYKYEYKKMHRHRQDLDTGDSMHYIYVSFPKEKLKFVEQLFIEISETYMNQKEGYIVGRMLFSSLKQILEHPSLSAIML